MAQLISAPLTSSISQLISERGYDTTDIGFLVQKVGDTTAVVSLNPQRPYYVASVQKLITGATAFDAFGSAHHYKTDVFTTPLSTSGEAQVVAIKGGGDPSFTVEKLWLFALSLKHRGLNTIDTLMLDNTLFDTITIGPGFSESGSRSYLAPITALSANFNTIAVHVLPGTQIGHKATISTMPQWNGAVVVGSINTVSGKKNSYKVSTINRNDTTIIQIRGTVGIGAKPKYTYRKVWNTEQAFAASLQGVLASVGISFSGTVVAQKVPANLTLFYTHSGDPLYQQMTSMFKYSNNFIAEMTLKSLGAKAGEGSWKHGVQTINNWWSAKLKSTPPTFNNGSGMAGGNRATPSQIMEVLTYVSQQPWRFEFEAALPVAGVDGTLATRFKKSPLRGNLRAKTGTLNSLGAHNMAGYFDVKGEQYQYVLFINTLEQTQWTSWQTQELLLNTVDALLTHK